MSVLAKYVTSPHEHAFLFWMACFAVVTCPWLHFSSGWTSEAEVWGGHDAAVCREESPGSLSEHNRAGAAGSTAADTDAAGRERPLMEANCCWILLKDFVYLAVAGHVYWKWGFVQRERARRSQADVSQWEKKPEFSTFWLEPWA